MKILIVVIVFIGFILWACCVAAGRADRALQDKEEGKPLQSLTLGVEVKRCNECERVDLSRVKEEIQKELDESAGFASEMEYRAGLYRVLDIIEEVTRG